MSTLLGTPKEMIGAHTTIAPLPLAVSASRASVAYIRPFSIIDVRRGRTPWSTAYDVSTPHLFVSNAGQH